MIEWIRNRGLNFKFSLLGIGSVLITAGVLVTMAVWESGQYNALAQKEVDELIDADLDHITQGVYNLVQTENEAVQQQINYNLNVARYILTKAGPISFSSNTIPWNVTNQFTNEIAEIKIPQVFLNGRWLEPNTDPNVKTPIVDEIADLIGETATIFQRMNERGDMLRVATTIRDSKNQRAIATYIPAIDPDGTPNPVVDAILRGEPYQGRAYVVNDWYLTAYEPIRIADGSIVGMLYVGVLQKHVEARVRQAILNTNVGKTGYVYILGGKGEHQGHYIISNRGERDGEDIWENVDSDGRFIIQDIVKIATSLQAGEMATYRYRWQNPGEPSPRWKTARLAYYEPWDWVIGTSVYDDELQAYSAVLTDGRKRMTWNMILAGLSIAAIVSLMGVFLSFSIVRPIRQLKAAVETIIQGNLDRTVKIDSHDEIGALAQTFNQMTARLKQTLQSLRDGEEKYRRIFENAVEGLFQTSLEGQILNASPAMARMLAYDSPSDMIQSITNIQQQLYVRPEERDEILASLMQNGSIYGKEIRFYRKDKQPLWVSFSASVIRDETDKPLFIQGFIIDITDRKNLEEQLLQSQKMEALGRLAGGIAHDFNNLLTVITGYCDLILSQLGPDHPLHYPTEEIQKAGERAASLTHQLLAYSRKQVLQPTLLNINELILNMEKMLRRLIGENIELCICPAFDLQYVKADPTQIEQVVMNLTLNARDAMPEGGKLTIETANAQFDSDFLHTHADVQEGRYVQLAISDTGYGMDKETLKRIFDPFFTTKEVGKGTGLGLPMVYGIVKQSGGYIFGYSEPGQGTTIKIYLPQAEETCEKDASGRTKMNQDGLENLQGTETILVVEDEAMVRGMVKHILQTCGYTVLQAGCLSEALQTNEKYTETIHLLITDVILPEANGRLVAERIQAVRPGLRVIFISGYTENALFSNGTNPEGLIFIQKPFSPISLLKKVREVLDRPANGQIL